MCPKVFVEPFKDVDGNDYFFDEREAETMGVQKCPVKMDGVAKWKCDENGEWEGDRPDFR